jgi:uncharacterized protein YigE (DUF2233 family)
VVKLKVLGLILLWCACLVAPLPAGEAEWSHTCPEWRVLSRGLSFAEIQVFRDDEVVEGLAVVKIDPAANAFRIFHHVPQSIAAWQQEIKAAVVFNASYYGPGGKPIGLILADGKPLGPLRNPQMRGMFVAEPKGMSPDLPRATILDLALSPVNPKKLPWTQGVQSFPLLLDYKGQIRVRSSERRAHRTVIAADRVGNILVFNSTNGYFTLYELARFLKESALDIDSALNLDGGTEAQLLVKTKDFEYFSPPSWENRIGNYLDRQEFWLPTVVGVFPRRD